MSLKLDCAIIIITFLIKTQNHIKPENADRVLFLTISWNWKTPLFITFFQFTTLILLLRNSTETAILIFVSSLLSYFVKKENTWMIED